MLLSEIIWRLQIQSCLQVKKKIRNTEYSLTLGMNWQQQELPQNCSFIKHYNASIIIIIVIVAYKVAISYQRSF